MIGFNSEFLSDPVANQVTWGMYALPGDSRLHFFLHRLEGDRSQDHRIFLFHPFDSGSRVRPLNIPFQEYACMLPEETARLDFSLKTFWKGKTPTRETSREEYIDRVSRAIGMFNESHPKMVLGREKSMNMPEFRPVSNFLKLRDAYPETFTWFLTAPFAGTWMGASPELLLEGHDSEVRSVSLAGTRIGGTAENWGPKETREQELVTAHIREIMSQLEIQDLQIEGPVSSPIGHVEHLKTSFTGKMEFPDPEKLRRLMQELHPTPAVGGSPKQWAMENIANLEKGHRTYYAGYLGLWNHQHTQCSVYVNLRCMEWDGQKAWLHAGAGITRESEPEAEWQETEEKMKLLARVLF